MHAPVMTGETRSCVDVGYPGGGGAAVSELEMERDVRGRWKVCEGFGLGSNLNCCFFWVLLGLQVVYDFGLRPFL